MCGICGIVHSQNRKPILSSNISSMCQTLRHRGPDDQGVLLKKNVALGIQRLSVIDPETGHQPLSNEDKSLWVVHNGAIYNFPSLRSELKSSGHVFTTRTDTETIVHGYEEWGEDFVHKLRGMFAFALWDGQEKQMLLVRDRIGIKPLYYALLKDKSLIFASEIKAILVHPEVSLALEPQALDFYLALEYIPAPLSIFKNIYKIPAGCMLFYKEGHIEIKKYWEISSAQSLPEISFQRNLQVLKDELYYLLKESVKLRLISEVPLGAFLSGGIDSSSIVGLMKELGVFPLKTFSLGFKDSTYNELSYARNIADQFNAEHTEGILQPETLKHAEKIICYLDEPLGDFSIIPTYHISKLARESVKVVLSGDGGDELFAGYEHYLAQKLAMLPFLNVFDKTLSSFVKKFPELQQKKGFWNSLQKYCQGLELDPKLRHVRWMTAFSLENRMSLYTEDMSQELGEIRQIHEVEPFQSLYAQMNRMDPLNRELYLDFQTYLPDNILVKVDRMSMVNSLEVRVPLLDHKIVEFIFKLPGKLKIKRLTSKWIFKKTMERLLPKQNIYRSKEGFSAPVKLWLKKELKELMLHYLNEKRIKREGIFKAQHIDKMINLHLRGTRNFSHQLWSLLVFEIWREKYMPDT